MSNDAVRLERPVGTLPDGFESLRSEARAEGYRHLDRLAADWDSGALRFARSGEALLVAYVDGEIAGIGGITLDPALPGSFRMRRFYVRKGFRKLGIGRRLAAALIAGQAESRAPVTVNAAAGSVPFWESLGFFPDERDGHTHRLIPAAEPNG
jgi:GNAT superfamily N-acetyltransferase